MKNLQMRLLAVMMVITTFSVLGQKAKITVIVVDLDGMPIANAPVTAGFSTSIKPGYGWGGGRPNIKKGFTDEKRYLRLARPW